MLKYCQIINEETGLVSVGIGTDTDYYISIGMTERNVEKSDKDGNWYLADKCPHLTPKEKKEREKERVGNLTCTKRVFVLMLKELGLNYFTQLKPAIDANEQAALEWELCVELQRKNPLIDQVAAQFSITPTQIDNLFKYANGEITEEEFLA